MFESVDIYDRNIYESYERKKDFFPHALFMCGCVVIDIQFLDERF